MQFKSHEYQKLESSMQDSSQMRKWLRVDSKLPFRRESIQIQAKYLDSCVIERHVSNETYDPTESVPVTFEWLLEPRHVHRQSNRP